MGNDASELMKRTNRRISMPDVAVSGLSDPLSTSTVGQNAQPQRQKAYRFDDVPMQKPKPMSGVPNVGYVPSPHGSSVSSVPIIQGRIISSSIGSTRDGASVHSNAAPSGLSIASNHTTLTDPILGNARSLSNVTVSASQIDVNLGLLYHDFLRKRIVPDRHMVVPHEAGQCLLMESDMGRLGIDASHGDISALLKLKSEKHDEKEETWNKLT